MYQKIVHQKRLYMAFIVVSLLIFQYFYTSRFTNLRFIQFLIVDLSLVAFVFAFHGFELNTLKSKNATVISSALGSFFGVLLGMFLVILFFGAQRDIYRHEFIATTLASIIGLPIFSYFYYRLIFKHIPITSCIVLGDPATYKHLLDEISYLSHNKVVVSKWITTIKEAEDAFKEIESQTILIANLEFYRTVTNKVYQLEKGSV